jgi:hypothetical protein
VNRPVAILIPSRGREEYLAPLVEDMVSGFLPALKAGGLGATVFVYAQNYERTFLAALEQRHAAAIAAGDLVLHAATRKHTCIGDVMATAIREMGARVDYRLAMLLDDDSRYRAAPDIDANLARAANDFLGSEARAFSIKLGQGRDLGYDRFVDPAGPIAPFKEKMLWVSRAVLDEALATPHFAELSIGEDAVLSALAWRGGPERCKAVFGIASFLHLAFEPDEERAHGEIAGGYGELMEYDGAAADPALGKYEKALKSGVTPWHVLPDLFVGPEHAHFVNNGLRADAVARVMGAKA